MRTASFFFRVGLAALALFFPATARAEGLALDVRLTEKASFNSNPTLLAQGEKDLYGSTTSLDLELNSKTPTTVFSVGAGVNQSFFNRNDYDSTDFHGRANLSKSVQKWDASLGVSAAKDTTRTAELTTFGQDTGSVRRATYGVSPILTYRGLERISAALTLSYAQTFYDGGGFSDYTVAFARPSFSYRVLEDQHAVFSVQARRYQSLSEAKTRVDSLTPLAGWMFRFTPRFSGRIMAGAQAAQEKSKGEDPRKWVWNTSYEASVDYAGEATKAGLSVSRTQEPHANGNEALLTSIAVDATHDVNPVLSLSLGATYRYGDEPSSSRLERKIDARGGVIFHMTESLDLTASYLHKRESLYGRSETAVGHEAFLELVWRPYENVSLK